MNRKDILITGGAGFIGSHLVDRLVGQNRITVIDNLSEGSEQNLPQDVTFEEIDIRNQQRVQEIVTANEYDIIYHLAANADVRQSVDSPEHDFQSNIEGTKNLLLAARELELEQFLFASSAAVYGKPTDPPLVEDTVPKPVSPYGAAKLSGEALGFAYHETYGIPFTAIRILNSYGPRQQRYVMYDFLKKLDEDPTTLEVLGTGQQQRDFIYVADTVEAFIRCTTEAAVGEVFNVAGHKSYSIAELAEIMTDKFGENTEITYTGESWEGDIAELTADTSKIEAKIGFEPTTELEAGLDKLADWYRQAESTYNTV